MNNRNKRSDPGSDLYRAILTLKTAEECYDFFADLCTVSEMKAMEQRFEVAKLLNEGLIYNDILEKTAQAAPPSAASTAVSTMAPMLITPSLTGWTRRKRRERV